MNILQQIKYILFEIKNPIWFRLIYLLEKIIKMPFIFIKYKYNKLNIYIPYLLDKDYILSNIDWKFLIKSKSDYDYILNPYFERELKSFFISNGIFLDIWTHSWKWSIFIAKKWAKVYSFEPNPETFTYLKKNISLNNLEDKIMVYNIWIWNKNSFLNFLSLWNETWKSKFTENGNIKIEIITIDDFIKENNIDIDKIDLIKIDTEWFEFNVIKWMKDFLLKTKNVKIICEILENQEDKKEIFDFLEEYGFSYKKLPTPADYLFYKNSNEIIYI